MIERLNAAEHAIPADDARFGSAAAGQIYNEGEYTTMGEVGFTELPARFCYALTFVELNCL